jgi:enamine deaminase RidA (YjgF/YER057c/UK114 family)
MNWKNLITLIVLAALAWCGYGTYKALYDSKSLQSAPMTKRVIVPPELRAAADQSKMSPAIASGNHVFLTGVTGGDAHGQMPDDPEAQFRNAFERIGSILRAAGLTFRSVVEMTTYHVGLREHFDLFDAIRLEYLDEPYPAWTAVEVAGLRREGAIVEIRIIASTDPND